MNEPDLPRARPVLDVLLALDRWLYTFNRLVLLPRRRKRSRGGRRRRKSDDDSDTGDNNDRQADDESDFGDGDGDGTGARPRRRGRARSPDDPDNVVVKVREGRTAEDEITGFTGSTRLEAKKQRRREGREAGRRRAPIVSEAEFLARRESVKREMVVRQHVGANVEDNYTQIAVLEDNVLVEHYVARESQTSLIGNVYLGKVQNVLPSMEAAFIDIGAGRNAVLYAGEVDWSTLGEGKARKIEEALQPGQSVLVQVSKDPIGQKGARLTSQISIPGRFLVLVPGGQSNGISRKLPDAERSRLKTLLKEVLPEDSGVIVRTAAEGATEEQLTRDVTGPDGPVGGHRQEGGVRQGPTAAVRRARPGHQGRPRPVQRGLHLAGRRWRRRVGQHPRLHQPRRTGPRRAARPVGEARRTS